MSALLIVIHIIVCIALIMIVLLQTGKGADMGAAFGGGASNTLFGSTGASTFFGKATTAAAIIFMITSLTLAYMSGHRLEGSVMTNVEVSQPSNSADQGSDQTQGGQMDGQADGGSSSADGQPAPAPQSADSAPAAGTSAGTSE
jgi:preprotein translocase subunit SecG